MPALIFAMCVQLFDCDPVPGCRRLGAEDKFQILFPFIEDPVTELRPDLQALLRLYFDPLFRRFENGGAFQDEKELAGVPVKMQLFSRMRWHPFQFHRKLRVVCQVPSVAVVSPYIVTQRVIPGDEVR